MTYLDLIQEAEWKVALNKITLGEYDEMIKPLKREIEPQSCEDCVSREAMWKVVHECEKHNSPSWVLREKLSRLPSVTSTRTTGKWIFTTEGNTDHITCSICGRDSMSNFDYCPNCGSYNGRL